MKPFEVRFGDAMIADLRTRLSMTRLPDEPWDAGWEYGTNLTYLRTLLDYWRDGFDWRERERYLDGFAQYVASVDGLDIHFVIVHGKGPAPLPLVMTHGWPSSFTEMLAIAPLLADPGAHGGDPNDAFDVVIPSVPGFGFSSLSRERGFVPTHTLWAKLMTEHLGYRKFVAHGGDIGGGITSRIAQFHPQLVHAISLLSVVEPYLGPGSRALSAAEEAHIENVTRWKAAEGGYSHEQSTKPQTLAIGLSDSPAGLAAWILEKFRSWSDCGGDVESRFSKDELLTNISIYWATRSIGTSVRYYFEGARAQLQLRANEYIDTPTATFLFPKDLVPPPPREWIERMYNLQRYELMPRGGHFAAHEEPELLAVALRDFYRRFR